MTTHKNEIPVGEYLAVQPPKVDKFKPVSPPQPVDYRKAEIDPPSYRKWSISNAWTAAGWTIWQYNFVEDVILKGIYVNSYGYTYVLIRINDTDTTFTHISGAGLGSFFIPIPDWLMKQNAYIIVNGWLNTVNDGLNLTFTGIPKIN